MTGTYGLEWEVADVISASRMNRKSVFVGTGAQIAAITTTYAGMVASCTSDGNGFRANRLYQRNDTDTAWGIVGVHELPYLKLSTTIGDYTSPNAGVATSTASALAGDARWGTSGTSVIEDGTTYADQTAFDAKWVSSDTAKMRGNPTNDNIDFNSIRDSSSDLIYYDLGAGNISDTSFVCRFKIRFSTITTYPLFWIGLSSNTSSDNISQDGLFVAFLPFEALSRYVQAVSCDGQLPNARISGSADATSSYAIATSTDYYFQMTRTSATSYNIKWFSDSSYTTQLGSTLTGTITSGLSGLRYFKIFNYSQDTDAGALVGTVDDIQLWSGVSDAPIYTVDKAYDVNTSTYWKSASEASPAAYFDLSGSAREIVAVALNLNLTYTTVTAIKVRFSTTTSFSDSDNVIHVNVSDFTNAINRFLAVNFSDTNKRFVQVIGVGTGVLAINEIRARYGVSDLFKILNGRNGTRTVSVASSFIDSN